VINFISIANAADAATTSQQQTSLLTSFAPLVLIMIVFYFLLIRPQQKRLKNHQNMINNVTKGAKVITAGGILGAVVKVEENSNFIVVEISENVKVRVRKDTISEVINETLPTKATA
jgi:preprotein translocase subunit YajC